MMSLSSRLKIEEQTNVVIKIPMKHRILRAESTVTKELKRLLTAEAYFKLKNKANAQVARDKTSLKRPLSKPIPVERITTEIIR
jgi:hypothetical protein